MVDNELTIDPGGTECPVDFDRLDTDPNEQAKLKHLLEAEHYRRNIILLSDFERKYAVLFRKEATAKDPAELQKISQEYLGSIDPYYPVYVVKSKLTDRVAELIKASNVVYMLPPIYNRVGVVNNLGQDGVNIMQAFNNLGRAGYDDTFDRKKKQYSSYLKIVFDNMSDTAQQEATREQAKKLSDQALRRSDDYKNNRASTVDNDPGLEVQDIPEDMLSDLDIAADNTAIHEQKVEEEYL